MRVSLIYEAALLIGCVTAIVVLALVMQRVTSRIVRRRMTFYFIFAPGTALHEFCHWLAAKFSHTAVIDTCFFRPKELPDGSIQLGYVETEDVGWFRTFFVGIAPLLGASAIIYLLARGLLPRNVSLGSFLTSGWTYLFLPLVFLISLGLSPSKDDIKPWPEFLFVLLVLLFIPYVFVEEYQYKVDLSGFQKSVETTLRSLNQGLLLDLVFISAVLAVVLLVWGAVRLRRRNHEVSE